MRRGYLKKRLNSDLELHIVPGFEDNYFYLISSDSSGSCVVIDPGHAAGLLSIIQEHNQTLDAILLTHHHRDHTGGVDGLLKEFPKAKIICSPWMKTLASWPKNTIEHVHPGREFNRLGAQFNVIDVRGHTLDHIAFSLAASPENNTVSDVFVGDALFGAGCGGLFEGTHHQMLESLNRLKELPHAARLWCAHEYTCKNLRVARLLNEPNPSQIERLTRIESELERWQIEPHNWMTLPLTVAEELATNPFLRCDTQSLQKTIDTCGELETFKKVRAFRDQY